MRRLLIAVLAAATMLTHAPSAHAAPDPRGELCAFAASGDPTVESAFTGWLSAGPVLLHDDSDPTRTYTGTVTCTVQVNAPTHAGADACSVTGASTPVAAAAGGTCTFSATEEDNIYVCPQVEVEGGPTLYFHASEDPLADGHWTTDPNAPCALILIIPLVLISVLLLLCVLTVLGL